MASEVLGAGNAGSLAEPGSGVDTARSRPNYLDYLIPSVRQRRANPPGEQLPVVDGLLGYRLPDDTALDDVEVATQMLCVFIGGTETVPKVVAHGLWELLRHPDQLAAVRGDPKANVPVAREEMIRYCAPAQWFARTARKPFTIHDTTIEPGQRIISLLASANRDEREYPQPDEFIWNRPIQRSLAFGRGQHFCLGYHVARLEIAVMVEEWLRRGPDYRIIDEGGFRSPPSFPWGVEPVAGGGLTCGPIGSSRRICSSGHRSPRRLLTACATATCCCGLSPPGSAAATCRPFAVCAGHFQATMGAVVPKRTAFRSTRSSGKSSPAVTLSIGPATAWWVGRRRSTV